MAVQGSKARAFEEPRGIARCAPPRYRPPMATPFVRILALSIFVLGLVAARAHADDLADAKAFIGKQAEQIKKGDTAGLKAGFTKRLQDRITADNVKKAQGEIGKMTIDDLVESVQPGKDSLKIKMKGGRTLTTLVKVDGKWLADTVWFK